MTQTLSIDIWSDVMCPWCLVGWGNLSQALGQLKGEIEAEIRWHAFELNPDMPDEGEERTAHIARKYGRTIEQSKDVQNQMRTAAEAAGGHASIFRNGPRDGELFHPLSDPVLRLHQRLKAAFDPHALFNRGRMYEAL